MTNPPLPPTSILPPAPAAAGKLVEFDHDLAPKPPLATPAGKPLLPLLPPLLPSAPPPPPLPPPPP